MAQVSALCNGQAVLHVSHNARSGVGDDSPVSRFAVCLQALMADFRIRPTIADFEGHPIELYSALDPSIHRMVGGNNKFEFHRALLSMEKKANEHLAHLTQKYGYHFIFRIGLKEFYMTYVKLIRIHVWPLLIFIGASLVKMPFSSVVTLTGPTTVLRFSTFASRLMSVRST